MPSHLGDVNLWLALVLERHPHHAASVRWWAARGNTGQVMFCRITQSAFLRISTGRSFLRPLGIARRTNDEAWQSYELVLQERRVGFADEPADIEAIWKRLSSRVAPSPNLWTDTYLAAFAIAAGYRLVTFDKGFRQFESEGLALDLLTV